MHSMRIQMPLGNPTQPQRTTKQKSVDQFGALDKFN
jgi:hypothetical protein